MTPPSEESSWKQHFPTYHFKERDVALEEYKFAMKSLEAEERVFLNAANFSVIVGAALASLALGSLNKLVDTLTPIVPEIATLAMVIILTAGFAALSLLYFADRQKAVVFAARKVIVLRRMLGMSYGSLQLVLPNWRIEGADEPFSIRLFPGWNTYVIYPCYTIAGISSTVLFFVFAAMLKQAQANGIEMSFTPLPLIVASSAIWFLVFSWLYRKALFDTHESTALIFAMRVARAMRLKLVENIEYVIYRATLSQHELHRLKVDLSVAKRFLVHIEDKEFFNHAGISIRGLVRLALYLIGRRRRSGGSTITQQLVRTLFIEDQRKVFRRKLIEIVLALWFDGVFNKTKQLEVYLASVRFERGVFGIAAAMKYYFDEVKETLLPSEAFFLIERVSNIRSMLLVEKIDQTLRTAVSAQLLTHTEAKHAIYLYKNAVASGKIKVSEDLDIKRLEQGWELTS